MVEDNRLPVFLSRRGYETVGRDDSPRGYPHSLHVRCLSSSAVAGDGSRLFLKLIVASSAAPAIEVKVSLASPPILLAASAVTGEVIASFAKPPMF